MEQRDLPTRAELSYQLIGDGAEEQLSTIRSTDSGLQVPSGAVLLGVDTDGTRHLLIPVDLTQAILEDRQSVGVHLLDRTLVDEAGAARRYADLHCRRPELARLFASMVDHVLEDLMGSKEDPVAICRAVLHKWRELVEKEPPPPLSDSKLIGVLAELMVLERVAARDPVRAMSAWSGWQRDRVDFRRSGVRLEVKASLAREGRSVTVHGLSQLDAPPAEDLNLLFVRFERATTGDGSVPAALIRLQRLGVSMPELERRLRVCGYDFLAAQEYAERRFDILETLLFEVNDEFPRVVKSSFAPGNPSARVHQLQYRLDLVDLPVRDRGAFDEMIKRWTSD